MVKPKKRLFIWVEHVFCSLFRETCFSWAYLEHSRLCDVVFFSTEVAVQHFYGQRSLYTHTQAASASSVYEAGSCVVVFVFVAVRTAVSTIAGAKGRARPWDWKKQKKTINSNMWKCKWNKLKKTVFIQKYKTSNKNNK